MTKRAAEKTPSTISITIRFLVFTFLGTAALPVHAGGTNTDKEASRLFGQGVKAFESARIDDALESFKRAYALHPSYRILYHIARAEAELGSPHRAIDAFEGYLADGGARISPGRKAQVLRELASLRLLVGEVIVVGAAGAEVWIDGERKGNLPLAGPIVLPEGSHRLIVRENREGPCDKEILVRGGQRKNEGCRPDSAEIEMATVPHAKIDASVVDVGRDMSGQGKSDDVDVQKLNGDDRFLDKVAPWVATGIGGSALIAAIVCAIQTLSLNSELRLACTNGVCPASRSGDINRLKDLAAASDAMFVITAVFSAAAVTLFWAPWKKKEKETRGPEEVSIRVEQRQRNVELTD